MVCVKLIFFYERNIFILCNNCGDFIGLCCLWLVFLFFDVGIYVLGILIVLIYDFWFVLICMLIELSILICVKFFFVGWLWIYKDRMLLLFLLLLFSKIYRIFILIRKRNWRWDKGR